MMARIFFPLSLRGKLHYSEFSLITTNEVHILFINTTAGNNAKGDFQTKNGIL